MKTRIGGIAVAPWYKNSKWRCLVDMHIPDWNPEFMTAFDPARYAERMDEARTDACELYSGNCLGMCLIPTKVGHMHAGLGGKDLVGPTLERLKAPGRARVVYFNLWSRWAYDTHPDWRIVKADGRDTMRDETGARVSRFGQCCINSPGYRDYVARQIRQLCEDAADDIVIPFLRRMRAGEGIVFEIAED